MRYTWDGKYSQEFVIRHWDADEGLVAHARHVGVLRDHWSPSGDVYFDAEDSTVTGTFGTIMRTRPVPQQRPVSGTFWVSFPAKFRAPLEDYLRTRRGSATQTPRSQVWWWRAGLYAGFCTGALRRRRRPSI